MKKIIVSVCAAAAMVVGLMNSACTVNPCGAGEKECSDGTCAPEGNTCCGDGTSCPPNAPVCGPGVCYGAGGGGGGGSSCLSLGEETCANSDGVDDCAPIGADCCGNHHWCPAGHFCINGGTACQ